MYQSSVVGILLLYLISFGNPAPFQLGSNTFEDLDRYIITLHPGVDVDQHLRLVSRLHAKAIQQESGKHVFHGVTHKYNISWAYQGYAGHFAPTVIRPLRNHGDIAAIEVDTVYKQKDSVDQGSNVKNLSLTSRRIVEQGGASDGLRLISHRATFGRNNAYHYDDSAGADTFGYIIDSGIFVNHQDFGGRATLGYNAVKTSPFRDDTGHGTHVAGLVGSKIYGVSKKCNLVAVKAFHENQARLSIVLDAYNWAFNDIIEKSRAPRSAILLTAGGDYSNAYNRVTDAAFGHGVTTVTPAGNDGANARNFSPGSARGSINVGATDSRRMRVTDSNWGRSVSLFAPGKDVLSTTIGNRRPAAFRSGTSQAAGYVTGLVLYFKRLETLSDAQVTKDHILRLATPRVVGDSRDSNSVFAYNGCG